MINEVASNLGPQVIGSTSELVSQYVPAIATLGILGFNRLRQYLTSNGESNVEEAVVEIANDMVVHGRGRTAYFTHRDIGVRCAGNAKGFNGEEKIVPCRGVVRQGERQRIDRMPPHAHTQDRNNHLPSRLGKLFRRNKPNEQDLVDYTDD